MNPVTESSMVHETLVHDRSRELEHHAPGTHHHAEPARPRKSILRRLVKNLLLVAAVACGVIFGLYKMRVNIPLVNTPRLYASLDAVSLRAEQLKGRVVGQYEAYFHKEHEEAAVHHEGHKLTVTTPLAKEVTITQDYVCQIHSRRHINVRALQDGYLKAIPIKEGQTVKTGDLLFEIVTTLYKARLAAEVAERDYTQMELNNTKRLFEKQGVSQNEVKLFEAKLAKAQAKLDLAEAELNFCTIRAPFDGIVDRLMEQQGSLVKEGDILTTLSDNSVMWVYFNVPEKRYLEYMAETGQNKQSPDIELVLATLDKFPHPGKIGAIEANFNNENGNIAFRADFPNPEGLLRHGQTGKVLINRVLKNALVIPQRAAFENLAKRYVYVVGEDDVVHQKEIVVDHELEDIYVIRSGITAKDKIVLEGIRQVRDGEKLEYETVDPAEALKNQKNHAE